MHLGSQPPKGPSSERKWYGALIDSDDGLCSSLLREYVPTLYRFSSVMYGVSMANKVQRWRMRINT
jgi:hypothetical protein